MTLTAIGDHGFRAYLHSGDQLDLCRAFRATDQTGKPVNWTEMITNKYKLKTRSELETDESGKPRVFGES